MHGAVLEPDTPSPILRRGIERIRERSPYPLDILHRSGAAEPSIEDYSWLLTLEHPRPPAAPSPKTSGASDEWAVEVNGEKPHRVVIKAGSERARLFAMYHIARCLEMKKPPSAWPVQRTPLVSMRYAWISAGINTSPVCRPDWFDHAVTEIPGMGFNGVLLNCNNSQGTSIGRQTIPVELKNKGVVVDRFKLPAFLQMFDRLKSYGLDICLFHQAYVPPGFLPEDVRAHYDGKRKLPGLEKAIMKSSYSRASGLFTAMPQVDGLFHHSIECPWMWEGGISIFPCKDEKAGERAFDAYLTGLTRACKEHGKDLMYWTHVSNIPARQIGLIHRVLARHPSVVVVEDHAWPNETWPHSPVMGHVAEDVLNRVTAGRWGMTVVSTDGEFYGSGALPTAYPEPLVRSARMTADRGAECAFVRLNAQAMTPLSTLQDVNAINVLACSEVWWKPERPLQDLWLEWSSLRFGTKAAPAVVSALKKSGIIIMKGLSASGMGLLTHSGIVPGKWHPDTKVSNLSTFTRPGELLVDRPYEKLLNGNDFKAWLVKARGVKLEDFLRDNAAAQAAAREAIAEINGIANDLKPEDHTYLTSIFEDAVLMMEAVRRCAVGLHAGALYKNAPDTKKKSSVEQACVALEELADRIEKQRGMDFFSTKWFFKHKFKGKTYNGYGVPISLRSLAEQLRKIPG